MRKSDNNLQGFCRALYAISLLRYSKNIQFENASQSVMLVFDEAELLLEGRSNHALKRFIQESRKLNMAGVFVAQQKPTDKWLTNNLNQIVELEGAPVIQSAGAKIDVNAIKQARFTIPKPAQHSWLGKVTHFLTKQPSMTNLHKFVSYVLK